MNAIRAILRRVLAGDGGATAIEYGLIAALIAVTCIGGMTALGGGAGQMWGDISSEVQSTI